MKNATKNTKQNREAFSLLAGAQIFSENIMGIIHNGKHALDAIVFHIGVQFVESLLLYEREVISGPGYKPKSASIQKWGFQTGSVFLGQKKVKIKKPRLRENGEELVLKTYEELSNPDKFSDELLVQCLRGLSARRYHETLNSTAEGFGVSASSVSSRIQLASSKKLKELLERDLHTYELFAMYIDTIYRGGNAFIVALGLDREGHKHVLGFWEGATENHQICLSLLSDMESRGLKFSDSIIYITDGGSGIKKALKMRHGDKLIQQRCVLHKKNNISEHLPEEYKREGERRYNKAISLFAYEEAKKELEKYGDWLEEKNISAARSLEEAREELLTLHRLKVPAQLRKSLSTTNPIESLFSMVRFTEKNVKNYQNSKMSQRWLATSLLHCESRFRKVKGYKHIPQVMILIQNEHKENKNVA